MVDCTQRFRPRGAERCHALAAYRMQSHLSQKALQEFRVNIRHITGNYQVPGLSRRIQGREETAERAVAGTLIANHREPEPAVSGGIGNDGDISGSVANLGSHVLDQGLATDWQECLVGAHTSAPAACKDETGGGHAAGRAHERIITLAIQKHRMPDVFGDTEIFIDRAPKRSTTELTVPPSNRMVYICFLLFWGIMTSAGVQAANANDFGHAATTVVKADTRTGRLVRSVIINPKVIPPKVITGGDKTSQAVSGSVAVDDLVEQAAKSYDLDPLLVHSVIQVESNYNPYAISNKGAEGLMQLIPATARRFGAANSFNARDNIDAGVRYLKYLKNIFGDDRLALAAYNAGEGAVAKYGWIPPYAETQQYVYRVGKKYGEARRAAVQKPAPVAVQPVKPPVEEHPKLEQYQDEQGRVYLRTR